ncbi:MAG: DUF938 domain-containing protein [Burkholderiaceae bacterium]|nr:DUF938 domain-containing protein [Burkholderiaceae bacterium]
MTDGALPRAALTSPSVARNKAPILEVLRRVLPRDATVLEIASGTGEHVVYFAAELPQLRWIASDPDEVNRESISSWRAALGSPNVAPPIALDVRAQRWPLAAPVDAIVCINMIHIAEWAATRALFAGAAEVLAGSGPVVLYGPFKVGGAHTAPSNEQFDRWLRERDPASGVRDLDEVAREARAQGFELTETVSMPANNLCVVFDRAAAPHTTDRAGLAGADRPGRARRGS